MMSALTLPILALGPGARRPKRALHPAFEQREAHVAFDISSTKRQFAQVIGGAASVGARARLRRRAEAATRLPHPQAHRVARRGDGSQRLPRPVQGAHMLQRHTSVSSHDRTHDVCTNSPQPSPSAGARSAPYTQRLEQREAHDAFDISSTKRQCAQVIGGAAHLGARAGLRRRAEVATRLPQAHGRSALRDAAMVASGCPARCTGAQRPRSARSAERERECDAATPY
eukprot:CAMPEP_0118846966 /NCGR_PEP_ID=MMETSP1162-20130426/92730_1 /TAXON_ID=33656 /ORGANISM="Phaeocystis Sp, Strain CCMP2710" /LENGTH=227 /DNA_ID=CAMNT_0006779157 /DNA_START=208 /DNA_END=889 /DNA_ORIENTATION=-